MEWKFLLENKFPREQKKDQMVRLAWTGYDGHQGMVC